MHNHKKCKHKLEFCEHCDVVYCSLCKEEWKKNSNLLWTGTTTAIGNQLEITRTTPLIGDYGNPITTCSSEHKLNWSGKSNDYIDGVNDTLNNLPKIK